MAMMSDLMGGEDRQILSTGNGELDKKIADGIPLGSLTLIEGENDTGKSVLTQADHLGSLETESFDKSLHYGKHEQEFYQADGVYEPRYLGLFCLGIC